MNDADIAYLLKIREQRRQGVADRSSNGWKTNLGLWTALGTAIGVLGARGTPGLSGRLPWVMGGLMVFLGVVHVIFVSCIAKYSDEEASVIWEIDKCLSNRFDLPKVKARKCPWKYYSQIFQVCTTIVLGVLLVLVLIP